MLSFLEVVFSVIGFMITFGALTYGAICLIEQIQKAGRRRDERFKRIAESLDRIEAHLRRD